VRLTATLQDGTQIDEILEGYEAIIVQHEYDHLDGKLFIDHISRLKRNLYDTRVKKWLKRQSDKNPR
jgi:peptide deformylase